MERRDFLKVSAAAGAIGAAGAAGGIEAAIRNNPGAIPATTLDEAGLEPVPVPAAGPYGGLHEGDRLNRVAFPMGGMGAGMICLEGTGALSHVSIRNRPDVFNEPAVFAALSIKGAGGSIARVLEGPVPGW